ncbi:iron-only hydrogenase system regulator [bacterium]|nr:iron-only hydrogenase system regulator [bacterium]
MAEKEKDKVGDPTENPRKRIGVISIIIYDRQHSAQKINELLSDYGEIVIGRMGIPHQSRHIFIISVIVEGSIDQIGALTGKLGMVPHVSVKSHVSKWEDNLDSDSDQKPTT